MHGKSHQSHQHGERKPRTGIESLAFGAKDFPDDLAAALSRYVVKCFELETPPRVDEFASQLGVSRSTLARFRASGFRTLSREMKKAQLECAARMLRETSLPMNAIAYRCGFGTRRTFYRSFRLRYGITPSGFRAMHEMSLSGTTASR